LKKERKGRKGKKGRKARKKRMRDEGAICPTEPCTSRWNRHLACPRSRDGSVTSVAVPLKRAC
jgi:hypothetical protein